jgi:phosphatidylglycerol:prolipoprotein diacylglycerol transferase
MNPRFFQPLWDLLGIRGLDPYLVFEWVPFLLSFPLTWFVTRHIALPRARMFACLLWTYWTGLLGSKAFHILFDGGLDRYLDVARTRGWAVLLRQEFLLPWTGGQVFYGGILGGLAGCALLGLVLYRGRRADILRTFDVLMFTYFLISALGRVGCFFQGCCYGRVSNTFGLVFPGESAASHGLARQGLLPHPGMATPPLIPTQLIEVGTSSLILLFLFLRLPSARARWPGYFAWHALLFHAVARFLIEFVRFDSRGSLWGLSTSQWIACAVAIVLVSVRVWGFRGQDSRPHDPMEAPVQRW